VRARAPPSRAIDSRLMDVGLEIRRGAGRAEHEHAGQGGGNPGAARPRVMESLHRAGDDEGDGGEGDLDGVGYVEEGLSEPGEGVGAGRDDGEGCGARQGEMRRCGDGDGLVQHDDLSSEWFK